MAKITALTDNLKQRRYLEEIKKHINKIETKEKLKDLALNIFKNKIIEEQTTKIKQISEFSSKDIISLINQISKELLMNENKVKKILKKENLDIKDTEKELKEFIYQSIINVPNKSLKVFNDRINFIKKYSLLERDDEKSPIKYLIDNEIQLLNRSVEKIIGEKIKIDLIETNIETKVIDIFEVYNIDKEKIDNFIFKNKKILQSISNIKIDKEDFLKLKGVTESNFLEKITDEKLLEEYNSIKIEILIKKIEEEFGKELDVNTLRQIKRPVSTVRDIKPDSIVLKKYNNITKIEQLPKKTKNPSVENKLKELIKEINEIEWLDFLEIDGTLQKNESYEGRLDNSLKFLEDMNKLNLKIPNSPIDMKFRALGKHRASGLYLNDSKTVAIDINDFSSAIHEMFHAFEFSILNYITLNEKSYNRKKNEGLVDKQTELFEKYKNIQNTFERLINHFRAKINKTEILSNPQYKNKIDYFMNDREIFARMGELSFGLFKTEINDNTMFVESIENYKKNENIYFNFMKFNEEDNKLLKDFITLTLENKWFENPEHSNQKIKMLINLSKKESQRINIKNGEIRQQNYKKTKLMTDDHKKYEFNYPKQIKDLTLEDIKELDSNGFDLKLIIPQIPFLLAGGKDSSYSQSKYQIYKIKEQPTYTRASGFELTEILKRRNEIKDIINYILNEYPSSDEEYSEVLDSFFFVYPIEKEFEFEIFKKNYKRMHKTDIFHTPFTMLLSSIVMDKNIKENNKTFANIIDLDKLISNQNIKKLFEDKIDKKLKIETSKYDSYLKVSEELKKEMREQNDLYFKILELKRNLSANQLDTELEESNKLINIKKEKINQLQKEKESIYNTTHYIKIKIFKNNIEELKVLKERLTGIKFKKDVTLEDKNDIILDNNEKELYMKENKIEAYNEKNKEMTLFLTEKKYEELSKILINLDKGKKGRIIKKRVTTEKGLFISFIVKLDYLNKEISKSYLEELVKKELVNYEYQGL